MNEPINELLKKLDNLTIETKPLWGKMTAQHMVEHLIFAFRMSNGKLKLECANPPEKLPTIKRLMLSGRPLPQNYINPAIGENLLPLRFESLEKAKEILAEEIIAHYKYFEENPDAVQTNVTCGDLNKGEWEIFHQKHFTHHLRQFGIQL